MMPSSPRWYRAWRSSTSSSVLPIAVTPLFFGSHLPRSHGIAVAVGELDHHAEQITTHFGATQHIVYRILTFSFRSQHQRLTEADFFHLFRRNPVPGDVLDSLSGPDES